MDNIPKKALGQHWLNDESSLESICQAAKVGQGDRVLEIGPGTGQLTEKLLASGAKVIAVEYDQELIPGLQKKFTSLPKSNLQLEAGDIRTYDFNSLGEDY